MYIKVGESVKKKNKKKSPVEVKVSKSAGWINSL